MELKDLKNIAIYCETEEDAGKCCKLADSLGWMWSNGWRYSLTSCWSPYNKCYMFYNGCKGDLKMIKGAGYEIKSPEWFLQNFKINKDMEERNIKVSIATAKEWYKGSDKTLKQLALQAYKEEELNKKEVKVWADLMGETIPDGSRFVNERTGICIMFGKFDSEDQTVFINEKHAKSALAMSKISQLFPYFGGKITDEEWKNADIAKYTIGRKRCDIYVDSYYGEYYFLAFHKMEQRDNFMRYNERLVKDYLMLD